MSSNEEINPNDPEIDSVEKLEEKVLEPITPETNPKEFESINNVNDRKQPEFSRNLLSVNDEFTNEKSSSLIKFFHEAIKQYLTDPSKEFLLLTNTNVNKAQWKVIWANEPTLEDEILVFEKDSEQFKFRGPTDPTLPKPIFPIDAVASDYKIDDDNTQHFPTECLKLNNDKYWISERPVNQIETGIRKIVFKFAKRQTIKYFGINFHKPDEIEQVFDMSFMTDQFDRNTGDRQEILAFRNIKNLKTDGIQILEFTNPIITDAIALTFHKDSIGAINYVLAIENPMSMDQLEMFLSVSSENSDLDKAFKRG